MFLNLFNSNTEALHLLDWYQITNEISSLSHFDLTKHKLSEAPRLKAHDVIQAELDLLEQYLNGFDDYSLIFNSKMRFLPSDEAKFSLIKDLFKSKFFEAQELNFFGQLIENYLESFTLFKNLNFTKNYELAREEISQLRRNFLNPLREFVEPSGNISYDRHPLLRKLYADVLSLEQDLRTSIIRLSRSEQYSTKLQIDTYDIINDRYVLAVRSDSYNSDLGPIVARSQSGMTLFVEPYEIRDKSNKRIHLLAEIESIILKLTIDLSKAAHLMAKFFETISEFPIDVDWLNTKATYTHKLHLTKPILAKHFTFELRGLFHPLIKNPVKNNIELKNSHKGMIISGPNTGGKTVALKSMCLTLLFLSTGLYAPATYAEIFPTEGLFYFSHDHQNLSEGLSSFASESKYYLELLTQLLPHNLIVVDEIFNSTSSEEASALAMSFLDEIHQRSNSKVIISTHHQVLKTFMHSKTDYLSAHVGFDFTINRPTYKLIFGEPGSSLAFKIFENLSTQFGLETSISERAKDFLDKKQITYENLLQELSSKKIELDKLLQSNRQLNVDLKNQKSSMEGVLFLEKDKIYNEYSRKIKNIFNEAESLISQVKEEKITNRRGLLTQMSSIQRELNHHGSQKIIPNERIEVYDHMIPITVSEIKVPMTVFSINLRKNVTAINTNPRKDEVQIQNGAMSIWVSPTTLRYPSGASVKKPRIQIQIDRTVKGEIEIDCRGMRLDEFQKNCEIAIDEVLSGEIPFVTIIHGHGDGILKTWLRTHLKSLHKDLKWENIEGNDGCTKITVN
jgi:DNA mismatch repair protein MutS2